MRAPSLLLRGGFWLLALLATAGVARAADGTSSTPPVKVTSPGSDAKFMPAALPAALPPAAAPLPSPTCGAPSELTRLDIPLRRLARRLVSSLPITVVAIGSSSTAGAGATSPAASYPSRLLVELNQRFPRQRFTVINRGVNGEEIGDMLSRFDNGVFSENPDLVLWQVGTNSVLRGSPVKPHLTMLHDGIERLKANGADVVLIDPQFAPKVLAKEGAHGMVDLIALAAKQESVDLFRRFGVMRHWHETQNIAFDKFLSPDELHMNDWSYACVAKLLGGAIAEAATRPIASAHAQPSGR